MKRKTHPAKQQRPLNNALDFANLREVHAKYYTGFYLALSHFIYDDIESYLGEGYSTKIEVLTPQHLEIVSKSDRFAAVHSTGGSYNVTEVIDGETSTDTTSFDGVYYLKKMPDNSWKIYLYYEDEEDPADEEEIGDESEQMKKGLRTPASLSFLYMT
ncbi:hypothetical protein M3194_11490 [Paenibacillus glycanilyticus]|uniref:hypothetical protein n=1 Tax=Paenibacillus glycanilyticus TaxID=126569 RepID=UPI00203F45D8|nr:hypothetical protein [Paenibacillus glycanilyticus]MCM3627986.1 hypothetical protein [Paenibacillus glycanilyticus]